MASKSETGYAVNIINLEKLWNFVVGFGPSFQPTNPDILPAALKSELDIERTLLQKINLAATPWVNAVNDRQDAIHDLSTLCRKIYNSTASSKASANFIADVQSLVKKITGVRATPKIVITKDSPPTPSDKIITQISASQMGIDNRLNHFDALIQLLKSQAFYTPNETDLQTISLETKYAAISAANSAVIAAFPALDNARIELKDRLYYASGNGSELAGKLKKYVRSAYGLSSPQYKQISALKFTKPSK